MQRTLNRSLLLLLLAALLLPANPARAQGTIEILEQEADYLFNNWLHFSARYESSLRMQEAFVFYQLSGSQQPWVFEGELGDDQSFDLSVPLTGDNQPAPFTTVTYWFRFASDHGDIFESEHYTFYYQDNRYAWQTVQIPPFAVNWHNGDQSFAESILASAQLGVLRVQSMLPLSAPEDVIFWVYDNPEDVQLLAQQAGFAWQAGHTDPQAGLILLSLPPGAQQSLEIQRQVPHEVAHLMLYQALGAAGYARLPAWLNEGIASNTEIYSDPSGLEFLELAESSNALIPLYSLCAAFPQDAASARLAYAESASFVRYLFKTYNSTGFGLLLDAYAGDGDCLTASQALLGKDLIALDAEWRAATFSPSDDLFSLLANIPWQTIASSAAIALILFLVLRRLSQPSQKKSNGR